jgi:hypothetical protein
VHPPRPSSHPADRVLRVRLSEPVRFPDLTERRALKLSAVPHYTSRAHFGLWHRRVGGPDFTRQTGVFTPLYYVELEVTDVALDPQASVWVRGETGLAKTLDAGGGIDHLLREGRHTVLRRTADGVETVVAQARLINVFTRYDADPARRRVTALPATMGLVSAPARVTLLPRLESLLAGGVAPDFAETDTHVWHYGQTDPNRHVSGMEYLRAMEAYIADELQRRGRDLGRLYYSRARILYRKPCFRGERYRRAAWLRGETPLVLAGAFYKGDDPPSARAAVAVELTLSEHAAAEPRRA